MENSDDDQFSEFLSHYNKLISVRLNIIYKNGICNEYTYSFLTITLGKNV